MRLNVGILGDVGASDGHLVLAGEDGLDLVDRAEPERRLHQVRGGGGAPRQRIRGREFDNLPALHALRAPVLVDQPHVDFQVAEYAG